MNSQRDFFTQQQLETLARDPKNRVYQYVNDEATTKFTSDQQRSIVQYVRQAYETYRKQEPHLTDVQIRRKILTDKPDLAEFEKNLSRIWQKITDRQTTAKEIEHVYYMIYMRYQMERGMNPGEAQAYVQDYFIRNCSTGMTLEQYKKQTQLEDEMNKAAHQSQSSSNKH